MPFLTGHVRAITAVQAQMGANTTNTTPSPAAVAASPLPMLPSQPLTGALPLVGPIGGGVASALLPLPRDVSDRLDPAAAAFLRSVLSQAMLGLRVAAELLGRAGAATAVLAPLQLTPDEAASLVEAAGASVVRTLLADNVAVINELFARGDVSVLARARLPDLPSALAGGDASTEALLRFLIDTHVAWLRRTAARLASGDIPPLGDVGA